MTTLTLIGPTSPKTTLTTRKKKIKSDFNLELFEELLRLQY